ncbi:hypothetical protein ABFS83_08G174300 [Erythranthe nasuta]
MNNISINNIKDESRRYKSTWGQRAWFAWGCATLLISIAKSTLLIIAASPVGPLTWVELTLAALIGYAAADLGSRIFHWAIDNYGGAETPIFGFQIESFRAHHQHPNLYLTKCDTAGVLYVVAAATTFAVLPFNVLSGDAALLVLVGAFAGFVMFSMKFHVWAHTSRRKLPRVVAALQDAGVILPWSNHAKHHRPPFDGYFCTVSGVWNRVLDEYKFFAAAKAAVFCVAGVRPRSWSEPSSDWSHILD